MQHQGRTKGARTAPEPGAASAPCAREGRRAAVSRGSARLRWRNRQRRRPPRGFRDASRGRGSAARLPGGWCPRVARESPSEPSTRFARVAQGATRDHSSRSCPNRPSTEQTPAQSSTMRAEGAAALPKHIPARARSACLGRAVDTLRSHRGAREVPVACLACNPTCSAPAVCPARGRSCTPIAGRTLGSRPACSPASASRSAPGPS